MSHKTNFLLTTPLKIGFKKPLKKNFYLLGEWCNLTHLNNSYVFKVQKHHWTNFNKLKKDSIFIEYKDKELTLFLDGHYSGKDTYKGTSDTLIKYELDLLSKYIKDFKEQVVLMTGVQSFPTPIISPSTDFSS